MKARRTHSLTLLISNGCKKRKEIPLALQLELGLLGLRDEVGHEEVAHLAGGLVEEERHAFGTEALADDVELEAGRHRTRQYRRKYMRGRGGM